MFSSSSFSASTSWPSSFSANVSTSPPSSVLAMGKSKRQAVNAPAPEALPPSPAAGDEGGGVVGGLTAVGQVEGEGFTALPFASHPSPSVFASGSTQASRSTQASASGGDAASGSGRPASGELDDV